MSKRDWWFVLREGDTCEVQLLGQHGAAVAFAQFAPGASAVTVGGQPVPDAVLRFAERCGPGGGQYIDSAGHVLDWTGRRIG